MKNDHAMDRRSFCQLTGWGLAGLAGFTSTGLTAHAHATEPSITLNALNLSGSKHPFLPAETTTQKRMWMAFPHSEDIWGRHLLPKIQYDWVNLCRLIAKYEPVYVVCGRHAKQASRLVGLDTIYPVTFISSIANDDMWMRDTGCIFRDDGFGGLQGIKLNFNGWGQQQSHTNDNKVAQAMTDYLEIPSIKASVTGEGGGVICDGEGTLIANWSSWHGNNRNPGKSQKEVGNALLKAFNAQKIIWGQGIVGEDLTDDHIDANCIFLAPGLIGMCQAPGWAQDPWAKNERKCYQILKNSTDAKGRNFEFVILHNAIKTRSKSPNLINTYANSVILNGAVIIPNLGDDKTDAQAEAAYREHFPGRKIEPIQLDTIMGQGGGGMHCCTQQQPIPVHPIQ